MRKTKTKQFGQMDITMIQYFEPISASLEDMLKQLPPPILILEFWKNGGLISVPCNIISQNLNGVETDKKGICILDFVLKPIDSCVNIQLEDTLKTIRMFYRRHELGTYLIDTNNMPHYQLLAKPIDIEYKILTISTNNNRIFVRGELVSI